MRDGVTRTYRQLSGTYRYPKATQVSVRNTEENDSISIEGNIVTVKPMKALTGCAVYTRQKRRI